MEAAENMEAQKAAASDWFCQLRDEICAGFEELEDALGEGGGADLAPGRFSRTQVLRKGEEGEGKGGGGEMARMSGRVFEKLGVNVSTVFGNLSEEAQKAISARRDIPGMGPKAKFWASGISLVAHPKNPHVPAAHMNTRMFWTEGAWWFGGGGDLNPPIPYAEDSAHFHAAFEEACARHDEGYYPRFKAWADEYFFNTHRGEPRGVGGIFFDDHSTGDWEADFAFTQDVGRAFMAAYFPLVRRRMHMPWSEEDRERQLIYRGRYAEFNLVHDRGTKFGLQSGHDVEAVLMSLPPLAKWP